MLVFSQVAENRFVMEGSIQLAARDHMLAVKYPLSCLCKENQNEMNFGSRFKKSKARESSLFPQIAMFKWVCM